MTTAHAVILGIGNGALSGILTDVMPLGLLAVVGGWAAWLWRHGR